MGDILDWFGKDTEFSDETDDEVTVRATVNEKAMRRWALQYSLHTKIIYPESLREQIKEDLREALINYKGEE